MSAWRDEAACVDVDPDVFFPKVGQPLGLAREVCASCPVVAECLAYAVENHIVDGVWGGLTARERRGVSLRPVEVPSRLRDRHDHIERLMRLRMSAKFIAADVGASAETLSRWCHRYGFNEWASFFRSAA